MAFILFDRENNFAFIDSQNLDLAIQGMDWRLDFRKFRRYLSDRFAVQKAYLFIGYVPENQLLYQALQEYGYIVMFKPTLRLPNHRVKGNVDAELVLQTMIEYEHYDQAVIISSDGDFYCLVEYLATQHKLKRLIIPNNYTQ